MRPSRSSQSCPQHSISRIQYCRTLGTKGGGSTAQHTCNPLIACVPTQPSGCSQESAPVAVSFQPTGHAVWYRVRAAEVPADSEVNSLSLVSSQQAPGVTARFHQFSRDLSAAIFLGVLGAGKTPRIVPIQLPFVFAFFTFSSSALPASTWFQG